MVVKKAKAYWSFIKTPDDAGKFRVTFTVDDKTYKDLMIEIENCAEESRAELKDLEWIGSYKRLKMESISFQLKLIQNLLVKKVKLFSLNYLSTILKLKGSKVKKFL